MKQTPTLSNEPGAVHKDTVLVDQLLTNYHRVDVEPPEHAMLDYAVKVATSAHEMTDEDVKAMRHVGWTDEDILHITEIAAMFSYTGRLANALGLIANAEYGDLGRHPRHETRSSAGSGG